MSLDIKEFKEGNYYTMDITEIIKIVIYCKKYGKNVSISEALDINDNINDKYCSSCLELCERNITDEIGVKYIDQKRNETIKLPLILVYGFKYNKKFWNTHYSDLDLYCLRVNQPYIKINNENDLYKVNADDVLLYVDKKRKEYYIETF